MYYSYFNLSEPPFSISPDPKFLYLGHRHREALAHLLYGIKEGNGFVLLTGEVGTGKTTVCRYLLEQLPEDTDVALILNPKLSAFELVASACDELGIHYPKDADSIKPLIDALNEYLLKAHAEGRRTVLLIDEAQNLSTEVLEQVRLLTNLETQHQKLLQIILLGQPELRDMLELPEMRQVSQRITARYHLGALDEQETNAYIRHRLAVCGVNRALFLLGAVKQIYQTTKGVPRLINVLCDRCLLGVYAKGKDKVDKATVKIAKQEMGRTSTTSRRMPSWLIGGVVGLCSSLMVFGVWQMISEQPDTEHLPYGMTLAKKLDDDKKPVEQAANTLAIHGQQQLAEMLALSSEQTRPEVATQRLLQLWGYQGELVYSEECPNFDGVAMRCSEQRGNWNSIRKVNRPSILKLYDKAGGVHHVVISAVDEVTATLELGEEQVVVPTERLDPMWYGEYRYFWQPPSTYLNPLYVGDENETVQWVKSQMSELDLYRNQYDVDRLFDKAFEAQVIQFQQQHGLRADGIIGEQTLMQVNTLLARDGHIPTLTQIAN